MYGVVAHFDEKTEHSIKEIWKELSELSISTYAEEVPNRRPHITLASYNQLNIEEYIDLFEDFYKDTSKMAISLSSLGTFMKSGLLFVAPTPSIQLLNFHEQHHQKFKTFQDDPHSFYLPNRWVPHCTIANRLSRDKLKDALDYCMDRMKMMDAVIMEVSIIKAIYENNKCIGAPTVYKCFLN